MNSKVKIFVVAVLVILANVAVDRFTKDLAQEHLRGQGVVQVVGDFFILRYAENGGAFLSLGSSLPEPWRFIILSAFPAIALLAFFIYMITRPYISVPWLVGLSCILGGGGSNVYDRLINNGYVIDFMNFGIGALRTGILNVADLSIVGGAILLILTHNDPPLPVLEDDEDA